MKPAAIKKITLTTFAFVAALALSARANGPLASSLPHQGSAIPKHSTFPKLLPDEIHQIDDGTAEISIGLTNGGDFICLNEFAVIPGSETINSINIAWGTPAYPDPTLDGLPYTVVLWDDPDGDGDPSDANVLATASGVVANQGTDTFIHTLIPSTTVTTPNFFVGFLLPNTLAGQFPSAFDETDSSFPTEASRLSVLPGRATSITSPIMSIRVCGQRESGATFAPALRTAKRLQRSLTYQ